MDSKLPTTKGTNSLLIILLALLVRTWIVRLRKNSPAFSVVVICGKTNMYANERCCYWLCWSFAPVFFGFTLHKEGGWYSYTKSVDRIWSVVDVFFWITPVAVVGLTFSLGGHWGHGFGLRAFKRNNYTGLLLRTILFKSLVLMPRVKFVEKWTKHAC